MQQKCDNYQTMAMQAQQKFLTYDQSAIIDKTPITYDETYLYLPVLDRTCRIHRNTGDLFWSSPDGTFVPSTAPCDRLTVFDYLCDARSDRFLSGTFLAMANFGHMFHTNLLEGSQASDLELAIDSQPDLFRRACRALHGTPFPTGDIAYKIPFFSDMPVVVQFWHSDEDFPPQLRYFWDKNALSYLRYETMYYAVGILQNRLLSLITL